MSRPTFGTDGVRAHAEDLDDVFVVALGRAAARVLTGTTCVVGRDTRASGPRLVAALAHGLAAEGVAPVLLGVVPTPTVAHVAAQRGCTGLMVSASHNPWDDNGIKVFAAGAKLSDETEQSFEAELDALLAAPVPAGEPGVHEAPGEASPEASSGIEAYAETVIGSLDGRRLDGVRVVLDGANGAASELAPRIFAALGAEVHAINVSPDGRNINQACGSTDPEALCAAVVAHGAQAGLAFDGDADRVIAVDETGTVVDGDHLIALFAIDRRKRGVLTQDAVVVTVMTNLGFHLAMADHGIEVVQTAVGDRYVLEALEGRKLSLGGEQSGHIVFAELATTGDGILSGVQLLDLLVRAGRPLSSLAADAMTRLPQVLHNVRVAQRRRDIAEVLAAEIAHVEATLGEKGRVLLRPSGTEPLVRVMVEAPSTERAEAAALTLVDAVRKVCGALDPQHDEHSAEQST